MNSSTYITKLFTQFSYIRYIFIKSNFSQIKYTAKLIPGLEKTLEEKEMKHRKHPGIRKNVCFSLPERLISAINKVMYKYDKEVIKTKADEINTYLYRRRLPLENLELQIRMQKLMGSNKKLNILETDDDEMIIKKHEKAKKMLGREIHRWQPIDYDSHTSMAYLVARMAANYAAIMQVFSEIMYHIPSFKPTTCFDFGSGTGSAVWAAHSVWGENIKEWFCVDASADMNDLSQLLLQDGDEDNPMFLKSVFYRQFLPTSSTLKYDLVTSAFSFMDLPSAEERLKVIDILWQKTKDTLVIIESGGNAGFSAVLDARDYILKIENDESNSSSSGAYVVAPCPHNLACPRFETSGKIPCRFEVSYKPLYRKQGESDIRKDIFSYVVLKRGKKPDDMKTWPRIISPILARSKHVHCQMCCEDGKLHRIIFTKAKHGRHAYRCARQSSMGDLMPIDVYPLSKEEQNLEDSSEENSDEEECSEENSSFNEGVSEHVNKS